MLLQVDFITALSLLAGRVHRSLLLLTEPPYVKLGLPATLVLVNVNQTCLVIRVRCRRATRLLLFLTLLELRGAV